MSEKEEHTPTVDCHRCPLMRVCGVRDPRASLNLEAYENWLMKSSIFEMSVSFQRDWEAKLDKDHEKMVEVTTRCPLVQIHDAMKAKPAEG